MSESCRHDCLPVLSELHNNTPCSRITNDINCVLVVHFAYAVMMQNTA